jgi:hypothetical protein
MNNEEAGVLVTAILVALLNKGVVSPQEVNDAVRVATDDPEIADRLARLVYAINGDVVITIPTR